MFTSAARVRAGLVLRVKGTEGRKERGGSPVRSGGQARGAVVRVVLPARNAAVDSGRSSARRPCSVARPRCGP